MKDTDVDKALARSGLINIYQNFGKTFCFESHANETLYNLRERMLALLFSTFRLENTAAAPSRDLIEKFTVKLGIPGGVSLNISLSTYLLLNSSDAFSEDDFIE